MKEQSFYNLTQYVNKVHQGFVTQTKKLHQAQSSQNLQYSSPGYIKKLKNWDIYYRLKQWWGEGSINQSISPHIGSNGCSKPYGWVLPPEMTQICLLANKTSFHLYAVSYKMSLDKIKGSPPVRVLTIKLCNCKYVMNSHLSAIVFSSSTKAPPQMNRISLVSTCTSHYYVKGPQSRLLQK